MNKKIKYLFFITLTILINLQFVSAASGSRQCITCGNTVGIPAALAAFSRNAITFVQLFVPVIIILVGIIGYFKAVISGDDKVMKEATNSLIKKIIVGIVIFLVVAIIKILFGILVGGFDDSKESLDDPLACLDCFISNESSCGITNCPSRAEGTKPGPGPSKPSEGTAGSNGGSGTGAGAYDSSSAVRLECRYYGVSDCNSSGYCRWNGSECVSSGGSSNSSSGGGTTSCSSYGVSTCAANGCKWNGSMCVDKDSSGNNANSTGVSCSGREKNDCNSTNGCIWITVQGCVTDDAKG